MNKRDVAHGLIALLGFAIPIATAGSNVFFVLTIIAWFSFTQRRQRWSAMVQHPVARAAMFLFAFLALGCFYGDAGAVARGNALWKYIDLLLIGLLVTLIADEKGRRWALYGFMAAQFITLILSTLLSLGLLPDGRWRVGFGGINTSGTIFKLYIQQSWLMAIFALVCFLLATELRQRLHRQLLYAVSALASLNIFFMVQGRTGYVVLGILMIYGLVTRYRWKGLFCAGLAGAFVLVIGFHFSPNFNSGVTRALADIQTWTPGVGAPGTSSQGLRLDFWHNTLPIIAEHPIIGVGTGSFPEAFSRQVANTSIHSTTNPHQQYLLLAAQNGLIGLALLFYFFWTIWKQAATLPGVQKNLARGVLLAMGVGCLFNSLLVDHTEGMFFAWAIGVLFAATPAETNSSSPSATS